MNPVNPAPAVPFTEGVVVIPDHETFETLFATRDALSFLIIGPAHRPPSCLFR